MTKLNLLVPSLALLLSSCGVADAPLPKEWKGQEVDKLIMLFGAPDGQGTVEGKKFYTWVNDIERQSYSTPRITRQLSCTLTAKAVDGRIDGLTMAGNNGACLKYEVRLHQMK